jgi:hypothetical protein
MKEEKIKYKDLTKDARKKYESFLPETKEAIKRIFMAEGRAFAQMWDILKAIEKKYGISVMEIAHEIRWKQAYEAGHKAAKNYEKNGLKELYEATSAQYEAICDVEWFVFNDDRIEKKCRRCPMEEVFREMGRTPEEMKEWAPLFCSADTAFWSGFNPEFEVFSQPRLLMKGDPHCTYVAIHHWEKEES